MWEPPLVGAIKKDVNAILCAFHGQANLSFSSFKALWVQQLTSYLHFGAHANMDRDAFYQMVYDISLRLLHCPPVQPVHEAKDISSSLSAFSSTSSGRDDLDIPFEGCTIVWNIGVIYFLYTFAVRKYERSSL